MRDRRPFQSNALSPPERPDRRERWALFLDVDGTLLELADTPDAVRVPSSLVHLLGVLDRALAGAVALVSGRTLDDLDRLFQPLRLAAAGVHGAERRRGDGGVDRVPVDAAALDAVRQAFRRFAALHAGTLVEDKGFGVTLHYRLAPALADEARRLGREWAAKIGDDFQLLEGKMVVELRARAATKGTALRQFLAAPPFAGRRPVYIGDDVTDEDAFAVVNELGGISVQVGDRQPTGARFRLPDVGTVHAWLTGVAEYRGE
jgi:trehalose 6-phosphate phosphatase